MTRDSAPDLLALHAVRVCGFADTATIARRFGLDAAETRSLLQDAEAHGWVARSAFAGTAGWSLTEHGRTANQHQLAEELAETGQAGAVSDAYDAFLPLNGVLLRACTDWQLQPLPGGRFVPNDHADPEWDEGVLGALDGIDRALPPIIHRLSGVLTRFGGYDVRFTAALARARTGAHEWVDRTDVDSCHRVWFELHEDLLATLGRARS